MDYMAGEKELSQEVKEQLKSMSNVRSLTENEKRDEGKKKKQALGGFIVLTLVFGYTLVTSAITWMTTGNIDTFLLVFIFYLCCLIGMLILLFCDKYNLKRYKQVFVIKGYVKNVIPYRGMTSGIIYYDFESCEYRTAVCRGEAFDKNKYSIRAGELVDVLAVEKRNGIRLLGFKPDTIS
ncbi:MAG: hypothetical protein NC124_16620 [Clostridium sp.]|nr:hypothetical protein [Clostridium sp.]